MSEPRFDLATLRDIGITLIVGTNAEKRVEVLTDFLWHKQHIKSVIAFSHWSLTHETLTSIFPKTCCFRFVEKEKHLELLKDVYHFQTKKQNDYKTDKDVRMKAKQDIGDIHLHDLCLAKYNYGAVWKQSPTSFCIIETVNPKLLFKTHLFRELFMNSRHHDLCLIILTDYIWDLPPLLISNINYAFILNCKSNIDSAIKRFRISETERFEKLLLQDGHVLLDRLSHEHEIARYVPNRHDSFQIETRQLFDLEPEYMDVFNF